MAKFGAGGAVLAGKLKGIKEIEGFSWMRDGFA
jgi:hypothetical protein